VQHVRNGIQRPAAGLGILRRSCIRIYDMRKNFPIFVHIRHSFLLLLAFAAVVLMVACSSAKPPAEETPSSSTAKPAPPPMPRHEFGPNEKVVGSVDILTAVPATQSESEHLLAQGWAASTVAGVPVTVVALLIDGKVVAETRSFDSRSDVGAAFGRPEFEKSGWKIEAPIKKLGPGRHPVTVRATSATGDKLTLPGVTLSL